MLSLPPTIKVYLAAGPTDMRKSFDSLAAAARVVLRKDPYSTSVFAFCSRRCDLVKLLLWDGSAFWLVAKRLARGTFAWPTVREGQRCVELHPVELMALLGGLDLRRAAWRNWVPRSVREAS